MWDASTAAAEKLYPGDYYTISNCRLKEDSLGYYEGRQQEVKFRKLNEAESEPMLKELLECVCVHTNYFIVPNASI